MTSLTRIALRLLLGISLLVLVLQFVDVGEALRALRKLQPEWIAASVACYVVTRVLMGVKWWVLLGGSGGSLSYATVQRALCLSDYYGLLFPNTLAVDVTRVILLRHSRGGPGFVTAAILADRVINIAMAAVISLLAMGVWYVALGSLPFSRVVANSVLGLSLLVLTVCLIVASRSTLLLLVSWFRAANAFLALSSLEKVLRVAERVQAAMRTMLTRPRTFLPATFLACLFVLARVGSIYFLFIAIGAPQTFLLNLTLVPAITLVALLPISILGLGLKDGAFVVFFGGAGVAKSLALGVSFTSQRRCDL
jgi:glycosyltransferase 2 family protein